VFETALSMTGSDITKAVSDEQSSCSIMHLYCTYLCLEFGFNKSTVLSSSLGYGRRMRSKDTQHPNNGRCLRILTMICEGKQTALSGENVESCVLTPSTQVRARHVYQQRFDELIDTFLGAINLSSVSVARICSLLLDWTVCYAIFLFLTVGLSSAVQPFQKVIDRIQVTCKLDSQSNCSIGEHKTKRSTSNAYTFCHAEDAARLQNIPAHLSDVSYADYCRNCFIKHCMKLYIGFLHHHLCIVSTPLRTLREPLSCALRYFPDDAQLLNVFLDVETAGCTIGGVREYFHLTLNQAVTPVPFIYAILSEKKRLRKLASSCQIYGQLSSLSGKCDTYI